MGNDQPKKIPKASKDQISIGCRKARIHLQMIRDRKNGQVIKGEKDLINKLKAKTRNKTEEILIAQRVVNGLKYAQACNLLAGYAASLMGQAHMIADNMFNPQKMEPWLPMIYSLIFAAEQMGLSSLVQFKTLMQGLNDPIAIEKYLNSDIRAALTPSPTAEELNIYMLQFSERNNIPLEEINVIGHRFTREWKNIPSVNPYDPDLIGPNRPNGPNGPNGNGLNGPNGPNGPNGSNGQGQPNLPPTSMDELERRLAEQFRNKIVNPYGPIGGFKPNPNQNNQGYNHNQVYNPNNQGYNPNQQNYNPNQQGYNPNIGNTNPNQQGYNPNIGNTNGQNFIGSPQGGNVPSYNTPVGGNLGPNFYVPGDITPNKVELPPRSSINSINDIDYYPQIDANVPLFNKGGVADPTFDQICDRLRKGL